MSLFNEILVGRFNKALQKTFSIKGGAPTPQLSTEIQPGFNFPIGVEFRAMESWFRYGLTFGVAAAAANNAAAQIRNPANSSAIVVIEKLFLVNTSAANETLQLEMQGNFSTDLGTDVSTGAIRFDARGQQNTSMKCTQQNTAPLAQLAGTLWFGQVPLNTGYYDLIVDPDHNLTILPGDVIRVRAPTVNTQLNCGIWWRERALEESELRT